MLLHSISTGFLVVTAKQSPQRLLSRMQLQPFDLDWLLLLAAAAAAAVI
jgi:hypothetical protein